MNIIEACGLVSTMDEFASTETPLLANFVKAVLTLLTAEINGEHLLGMPCWCGPDRYEVHQTIDLQAALGDGFTAAVKGDGTVKLAALGEGT